jgi:hypothetical protein
MKISIKLLEHNNHACTQRKCTDEAPSVGTSSYGLKDRLACVVTNKCMHVLFIIVIFAVLCTEKLYSYGIAAVSEGT